MDDDSDDASIIERVVSGDIEAFRLIVDRYGDSLYRFCRARLGDDADAEDAVQDVFVRAFRSLRSFDSGRSWASWLFAIAANRVKSRYSARGTSDALTERIGREEAIAEGADPDGPERSALDAIAGEALRAAVASLPAPYRAPVELYYFAGLGVSDTARALRLSDEAVKTRLFRARKALAIALGEKAQPAGPRKGRQ